MRSAHWVIGLALVCLLPAHCAVAADAAHWAFIPPARPDVPAHVGKNPIDQLLRTALAKRGLSLSPPAEPTTLIRRLHFDLVGLPPTYGRVRQFVADERADAYVELVDELLASPHFGERMAAHWLDLVRYADTNGYHGDNYRNVWAYRDYVINAFNRNKPFDEFTIEQLAGDLLPQTTREQKIASAYNRLNMITAEGGSQAKEYLAKYAADRVRTTSSVWMGVTLGCAECHDHKFDPFTIEDFYRFAAYFADITERGVYNFTEARWDPEMELPTEQQARQLEQFARQIAQLESTLESLESDDAAQLAWEQQHAGLIEPADLAFELLQPKRWESAFGTQLTRQEDQSLLATGDKHNNEVYEVSFAIAGKRITAVRLEALTHPQLTNGSLSRANGNFVLTGFELELQAGPDEPFRVLEIERAEASFAQEGLTIDQAIDRDTNTGWAVAGYEHAVDRLALFVLADPVEVGPGATLRIRLRHESIYPVHNMGCFRISITSQDSPRLPKYAARDELLRALAIVANQRSAEQAALVTTRFRKSLPGYTEKSSQLKNLQDQRGQLLAKVDRVLVSVASEPRTMRVLPRGNWMDESGPAVTPAIPAHLATSATARGTRQTRLELARWFIDGENPLTARVFVNRLWKLFFGRGLCTPLDDLGTQGELPEYPELLDWLATEFVASGWDMKHVIRLIVTSQAYRQSSAVSSQLLERDPYNRLFARQGRFRLEAEMVRDNALSVSGLLNPSIGGPSVKPYQPAGYWRELNFPPREYQADAGDALYRRGLYTFWMRTFLHPSLLAFDAPVREECTAERTESTTPLQALVLLNDPTYVEAARVLAERIVREGGGAPSDRIHWVHRHVLGREPAPPVVLALLDLYAQQLGEYAANSDVASQVLTTGASPAPADIRPPELAAWTAVARVLLNLHETITRY